MNKFLLIFLFILNGLNKIENKLPKGYWKEVFSSERGYHGKSFDTSGEFNDSNDNSGQVFICGFYFDDSLAIDYCVEDKKRVSRYSPADDIIADFYYYYKYNQNGDTIDYLPYSGLNSIFKLNNDTLIIQGEYRTYKFVKELDQKSPIFIIHDSVYYPHKL